MNETSEFETNITQSDGLDENNKLDTNVNNPGKESEIIDSKKKDNFFTNGLLFTFLLGFGLAFTMLTFIFNVVFTSIRVVGESMKPTINTHYVEGKSNPNTGEDCDIVFCYKQSSYQTNDIVVFNNTDNKYIPIINDEKEGEKVDSMIKRVIACPGETITFYLTECPEEYENDNEDLYFYTFKLLDKFGKEKYIDESYLGKPMFIDTTTYEYEVNYYKGKNLFLNYVSLLETLVDDEEYSVTIPKDCYYVMGDNRNNSSDSRFFGAINIEDITGKVVLQVEYGKSIWSAIWKALTSTYIINLRSTYEKIFS